MTHKEIIETAIKVLYLAGEESEDNSVEWSEDSESGAGRYRKGYFVGRAMGCYYAASLLKKLGNRPKTRKE